MTFKRSCLFLLLVLVFLIGPAAAVEEIQQDHIKSFSIEAPDGLIFSGIDLQNIDADSNTTLYLYQPTGLYTLKINSTKTYGSYWNFDIELMSPNGSVQTKSISKVAIVPNNYDLHVQYFWTTWNETLIDESYDIDIYTSIVPLSVSFLTFQPIGYQVENFYKIDAESTSYFDMILYAVTGEELEAQQENDILASYSESINDLFSWTWDMVLTFVGKIPGVGPYLASILQIAAITIDAIVFYFDLLFVEYPETTFLTVESFVLASAFCRRGNFWVKINRVCNAHLKIIETFLDLAEAGVNIMSKIISAVADAINALKPV